MPSLFVCYPHPTDTAAFERGYAGAHVPMVAPILKKLGATEANLVRLVETPHGRPHFHRIAEIRFPSMDKLEAALSDPDMGRAVADAQRLSTGGPLTVMVGELQTVRF